MTWTVRVYDSAGVEIGWVTVDPYEYAITHPDGKTTDEIRDVSYMFSINERPEERGHNHDLGITSVTVDFLEFESGQEHAEYIKDQIVGFADLPEDSIVVTDE